MPPKKHRQKRQKSDDELPADYDPVTFSIISDWPKAQGRILTSHYKSSDASGGRFNNGTSTLSTMIQQPVPSLYLSLVLKSSNQQMNLPRSTDFDEDLDIPSIFDAATILGNGPHSNGEIPSYYEAANSDADMNFVCLGASSRHNSEEDVAESKRLFDESLSSGRLLFGLVCFDVRRGRAAEDEEEPQKHTIPIRMFGDYLYFLPGEEGATFFKASSGTASTALFTRNGQDILCHALGEPWNDTL